MSWDKELIIFLNKKIQLCSTHMFYVLTLFTQQQQQQCVIIYLIYHGIISECLIMKKTESV